MEPSSSIPLSLLALLWAVFGVQLWRTFRAGKLKTTYARWLWIACFCAVVLITLSGRAMEARIDRLFAALPIAVYLKFWLAMLVVYAVYGMVNSAFAFPQRLQRLLMVLIPLSSVIVACTLPIMITLPPDAQTGLRNGLVVVRDGIVAVYLILAFIPTTYRLWRQETIAPMRLKHLSGLLFDYAYLLLSIANLWIALSPERTDAIELIFRPVVVVLALFFIASNLPQRAWAVVFLPTRLRRLHKLARLARRVARLSSAKQTTVWWQGIEAGIYQHVIDILDRYTALADSQNPELGNQIAAIVQQHLEYPLLVEQLASLL